MTWCSAMMSLIFLAAGLAVVQATRSSSSFSDSIGQNRNLIVGGTDAKVNEYGWFASIHKANSQQGEDQKYLISGGQLISEEFVLTCKYYSFFHSIPSSLYRKHSIGER